MGKQQGLYRRRAESLKGSVAVIDRGKVSFVDKLQRAFKAGALGVLVVNNKPVPLS